MQHDAGRIKQMSEDLLGVMDVAEQLMQTTFTNLCNALAERDDEIQRLRDHIADLEDALNQRCVTDDQLSPELAVPCATPE